MTVLSINILEGRSGKLSLSGIRLVQTYRVTFIAITDDKLDDEVAIGNHPDCPRFLSKHPVNQYALLTELEVVQQSLRQDGRVWHINCSYTTDIPPLPETNNPLDMPVKIEYRSQKRKRVAWADKDGKPILNTAWQTFDPPLEFDENDGVMTFTRNEASFSYGANVIPVINRTNSSSIWGADTGTLKIQDISAQNAWFEGTQYWSVTRTVEYRSTGWKEKILSRGLMFFNELAGEYERIRDKNGQDVTDPVCLDANGEPVDPASLPGAAYYQEFRLCDTYDFSQFNLSL